GKPLTQMIEGEKDWDVTVRWPARLRDNEQAILDIPVDITNNTVTPGPVPSTNPTNLTGPATGVSPTGTSVTPPTVTGSQNAANMSGISNGPRRRLGDLVTPQDAEGHFDPQGSFVRPGASTIYREQGDRLIAVGFSVRGRDLAGAVSEAREKTADLFQGQYRA